MKFHAAVLADRNVIISVSGCPAMLHIPLGTRLEANVQTIHGLVPVNDFTTGFSIQVDLR